MPITVQRTLYYYDELSDRAKETARDWWLECEAMDFGSFGLPDEEDIVTVAGFLGICFKPHNIQTVGGKTRSEPSVWWGDLEYTQTAWASFDGSWNRDRLNVAGLKDHAPVDKELHAIADALSQAPSGVYARIKSNDRGGSLDVEFDSDDSETWETIQNGEPLDTVEKALNDFCTWIAKHLHDEYEYRMSVENAEECIRANEYTFTKDGKREDA